LIAIEHAVAFGAPLNSGVMHVKALVVLPLLAIAVGCASVNSASNYRAVESMIGNAVPPEAQVTQDQGIRPPVVGLRPDHSVYTLQDGEAEFVLSADTNGMVWYVATSSSSFRTRGGIGPGTRIVDAFAAAAGPIQLDGDRSYMQLRNGWWAAFSASAMESQREAARLEWVFLRVDK
jgi:hypothetical protein